MKAISVLIYGFILAKSFATFLKRTELKISYAFIKHLEIRYCVFVGIAKKNHAIAEIKTVATSYVPVTFIDYDQLTSFIDDKDKSPHKIGLIFNNQFKHRLGQTLQMMAMVKMRLLHFAIIWIITAPKEH